MSKESVFDDTQFVTSEKAVVSLFINHKYHAGIIIESIPNWAADLPVEVRYIHFMPLCNVDKKDNMEKHFYDEMLEKDGQVCSSIYNDSRIVQLKKKSKSFSSYSVGLTKVYEFIRKWQHGVKLPFCIRGKKSIGSGGDNCLTWVDDRLKELDLDIASNLLHRSSDYFCAAPQCRTIGCEIL